MINHELNFKKSFYTYWQMIGALGIALPIFLNIGNLIFSDCHIVLTSLSQYFYSAMQPLFVGLLTAIGFFFLAQNGYQLIDKILYKIAGIAVIIVAFFPTEFDEENNICNTLVQPNQKVYNLLHNSSAAIFFIIVAYISYFLFTKSNKNKQPTTQKLKRNKLYKISGIAIILSIAAIGISWIFKSQLPPTFKNFTYTMEWVALIAFGTSWLVKGETIGFLNDK